MNIQRIHVYVNQIKHTFKLFSYIQGIVDESKKPANFILTGSQQFGLVAGINQSLAGRVGILELLPFSCQEIANDITDLNSLILKGFYPPVYDREIKPHIWYADYVQTYIERDVRKLVNIKDLSRE